MLIGIAIDLGTSGFRAQSFDMDRNGGVLSSAATLRHPIPGSNVIDHLEFAVRFGVESAQSLMIDAVNRLIKTLLSGDQKVEKIALCGNPIQLSIFQGIEIRDLLYAGKSKLKSLDVKIPNRYARTIYSKDIKGLNTPKETKILIPPAVFHEIGADSLAMIIQSEIMSNDEISIVTDYGTNAEMALKVGDIIYTGSTAAGPAIEGQQLECGMLALPGAICDVEYTPENNCFKTWVLDKYLRPVVGDTVDPVTGELVEKGKYQSFGITGTGVIALLDQGQKAGIIRLPQIETPDNNIKLSKHIKYTQHDLLQTGRAVGAFRAGHNTLCHFAGIEMDEVKTAYLCGASGTYVDPIKARQSGFYPKSVQKVYQVGNSSLAMARDLIYDENILEKMQQVAEKIRPYHCMFASSRMFSRLYMLELSFWTEGMPKSHYEEFLKKYGFKGLGETFNSPQIIRLDKTEIEKIGENGLKLVSLRNNSPFVPVKGCIGCQACVTSCPEQAIELNEDLDHYSIKVDYPLCRGVSCRKCEKSCEEEVLKYGNLLNGILK